ncbi:MULTISPECIES: cytochrome c oxidase subunit II transmembrane domain-containing protein [Pseudomonadati]|uniref:Cytochrome oxidase subunit II transmembrane region profile domain-containing protein n=1 Tax=Dyadobacter luticola TaxID=1979387 RepID=A0A5R9L8F7_9BACT|nr:hypothetical protein FEN17_00010 [Dyadobacter luticola]
MSTKLQLNFQDAASYIMGEFLRFHDYIMIFVVFITILIVYRISLLLFKFPSY